VTAIAAIVLAPHHTKSSSIQTFSDSGTPTSHSFSPLVLESNFAIYPRTLIDREISELEAVKGDFISADEEWRFTDPFNVNFMKRMQRENVPNAAMIKRFSELANVQLPDRSSHFPSDYLLRCLFERIKAEMKHAKRLDVWEKYAWLFDWIAPRIRSRERSSDFRWPVTKVTSP
jgi:hypothetical protein